MVHGVVHGVVHDGSASAHRLVLATLAEPLGDEKTNGQIATRRSGNVASLQMLALFQKRWMKLTLNQRRGFLRQAGRSRGPGWKIFGV